MKKTYVADKDFRVGEINKEIKAGTTVEYDDETGVLVMDSVTYKVMNLKSAIKIMWLRPTDNVYPVLDGPLGETQEEAADRKRKARFVEMSKKNTKKLVKDERTVMQLGGVIEEGDPRFYNVLGVEKDDPTVVVSPHKKSYKKVEKDDSRIVAKIDLKGDKTLAAIKIETTPKEAKKLDPKNLKVIEDQFDASARTVAKFTPNRDALIKDWSTMHWTKKADLIKTCDHLLLKELRNVESSTKIIERIDRQLSA